MAYQDHAAHVERGGHLIGDHAAPEVGAAQQLLSRVYVRVVAGPPGGPQRKQPCNKGGMAHVGVAEGCSHATFQKILMKAVVLEYTGGPARSALTSPQGGSWHQGEEKSAFAQKLSI